MNTTIKGENKGGKKEKQERERGGERWERVVLQ